MKERPTFHPGRTASVVACSVFLMVFVIYGLILDTGLIPGASQEVDVLTDSIRDSEARRVTVEGIFVDRDGEPITEAKDRGKPAVVLFDECYSYLIGYNSPIYDVSGLRRLLYDDLFYGGEDGLGAQIQLTTDNDLQAYCYEQLGDHEGSVIVMNASTGELLVCTSRSSPERGYNVNIIDQWVDVNGDGEANSKDNTRMYNIYADTCSGFLMNSATRAEDPPGSTFKIVTATAMLENGLKNYTYDDTTGEYIVDSSRVKNVSNNIYGEDVDLTTAMKESVNVYFASAAVEMGAAGLLDTARRFCLTEEVELDFTTLRPVFDLGSMTDYALLAHTAYGQGHTQMAPLHVAMIMGAVINDGSMMEPALISSITDDGVVESSLEPSILSETMDPQTASQIREYLHAAALRYGLTEDAYGMVYAKTGTAEIGNGNHIYMLVGIEDTAWGDLVVLMDRAHVSAGSSSLKEAVKNILGVIAAA